MVGQVQKYDMLYTFVMDVLKHLFFVSVSSAEVEDFDACLALNPFLGRLQVLHRLLH